MDLQLKAEEEERSRFNPIVRRRGERMNPVEVKRSQTETGFFCFL